MRSNTSRFAVPFVIVAAIVGCGESHLDGPDAGGTATDAQTADSATDASPGEMDAGPVDAALDAGVDGDGDGVGAGLDCDDSDPAVGSTATRDCTSACAAGLERCTGGSWGACDAPTDCTCTTPGATRSVTCGMCGIGSSECSADGVWSVPVDCFGEGECLDGATERETNMCGERARICDATCHWRAWAELSAPGECEVGAEERAMGVCLAGETQLRRCSATCSWEPAGACELSCTRPARASLTSTAVVCVPGGEFVVGAPDVLNAAPERVATISEFWVDTYPVTRARYQQCIDAGGCPTPTEATVFAALRDTQYAVGMSDVDARQFCVWDGGEMIHELQWEKAARGPFPDRRRHTWGDSPGTDCVHHPAASCFEYPFDTTDYPGAVSPYGTRLQGLLSERTSTRYRSGWAWLLDVPDPPEPGTTYSARSRRATEWESASGYAPQSDTAVRRTSSGLWLGAGFRCVY